MRRIPWLAALLLLAPRAAPAYVPMPPSDYAPAFETESHVLGGTRAATGGRAHLTGGAIAAIASATHSTAHRSPSTR